MLLRNRAAKRIRQKELYDFASAKYVGLLFVPQDEASTVHLKNFLHYLTQRGIKYFVLGYFDREDIPDNFLYLKNIDFITKKDLNFLFIPQSLTVEKFIEEPFDMIINCTPARYFALEYILQMSIAKFKVGIVDKEKSGYDLMIDISKERTIEYFFKNLEIYLSNLRNPK